MKKVGLLFGSFNPIHIGHLIIAEHMRSTQQPHEIWFVITPQNPFKINKTLLDENHRLEITKKSIADNPYFKICDIEFGLEKPNYTYKTLKVLREKYPNHQFQLIIGWDNYLSFNYWKNFSEILQHHKVLVYPRKVNNAFVEIMHHNNIIKTDAPLIEISSTQVRQKIKNNESTKYLITSEAEIYIKQHTFYQ